MKNFQSPIIPENTLEMTNKNEKSTFEIIPLVLVQVLSNQVNQIPSLIDMLMQAPECQQLINFYSHQFSLKNQLLKK